MGELYGDPLAKLGAEKAFQEAKYKLQKEYNQLFLKEELTNAKLQVDVATKEFEIGAQKQFLDTKQANVKIAEEDKKLYDKRLAEMKKWQSDYEKQLAEEVAAKKRAEAEKEAIQQKALELGQTLTDGAFGLYQANLSNELAAVQNRYDEEVRLADGNVQKLTELEAKKNAEEREIKIKQFRAEQAQAVARIIFETASIFAAQTSNPFTAPLAALTLAIQAAQIGLVLAQPVPEFAEGTKGKPFKGGAAIVGEKGVEKVVTKGGKVYFTPNKASLVDLPAGSEVVPNHMLTSQERFIAGQLMSGRSSTANPLAGQLSEIGSILKNLPITQLNMDERGFEKFIRTPRRTTKVLNNRFRSSAMG